MRVRLPYGLLVSQASVSSPGTLDVVVVDTQDESLDTVIVVEALHLLHFHRLILDHLDRLVLLVLQHRLVLN